MRISEKCTDILMDGWTDSKNRRQQWKWVADSAHSTTCPWDIAIMKISDRWPRKLNASAAYCRRHTKWAKSNLDSIKGLPDCKIIFETPDLINLFRPLFHEYTLIYTWLMHGLSSSNQIMLSLNLWVLVEIERLPCAWKEFSFWMVCLFYATLLCGLFSWRLILKLPQESAKHCSFTTGFFRAFIVLSGISIGQEILH